VPREIRTFQPTWKDRQYKKAFNRLPRADKEAVLEELARLIEILPKAKDLALDPDLAQFNPTGYSYKGVPRLRSPGARLYEYRLHKLTRVVVCHFASHAALAGEELLLLLAITVSHDHERIANMIRQHRSTFDNQS
jgi:hypothetical protein